MSEFETMVKKQEEIEELKERVRNLGYTITDMINQDYDTEDIKSYITRHLTELK